MKSLNLPTVRPMRDYHVTIRVQQGRLKAAMQRAGCSSVSALSRQTGVSTPALNRLLNFQASPKYTHDGPQKGLWRPVTLRLCAALGESPHDLFPDHLHHEVATNRIDAFVEGAQLSALDERLQLNPAEEVQNHERLALLNAAYDTLEPRERAVMALRFQQGRPVTQVAKIMHRCMPTINKISKQAIAKMRAYILAQEQGPITP